MRDKRNTAEYNNKTLPWSANRRQETLLLMNYLVFKHCHLPEDSKLFAMNCSICRTMRISSACSFLRLGVRDILLLRGYLFLLKFEANCCMTRTPKNVMAMLGVTLLFAWTTSATDPWLPTLHQGVALQKAGQFTEAENVYRRVLKDVPNHPDAMHLLGLILHNRGNSKEGAALVEKAIVFRPTDATFWCNLGELRRTADDFDGAISALERAIELSSTSTLAWRNIAVAAMQARQWDRAIVANKKLLEVEGVTAPVLIDLADALQKQRNFDAAEHYYLTATELDARAWLGAGVNAQQTGRLDEAENRYRTALDTVDDDTVRRQAAVNIASVFHERGELERAISGYREVLATHPSDSQALNNLGAALTTIGRHAEAVEVLDRCLSESPDQPQALVNLATHYANEGELGVASTYLRRARNAMPSDQQAGLLMRETTMMSPIFESTLAACVERIDVAIRVESLWRETQRSNELPRLSDPVSSVENVHFYLPYAGLNDRPLQEKISDIYRAMAPDLRFFTSKPVVTSQNRSTARQQVRVGFVSKFFGEHEPHGLLLEGVVALLPRDKFRVLLFPIASPGRPAASEVLSQAADELLPLGLNFVSNRRRIAEADLDVLVYADMLSEPMTYFLGFARLAPIQLVFWGNPITTGRPDEIDYFVSADRMEKDRTRGSVDTYAEQVVLLDGQGIWYRKPPPLPSKRGERREFSFNESDVILLCPQSNFKLHPNFDIILAHILKATRGRPLVKVVLTEGRRQRWTDVLRQRVSAAVDPLDLARLVFLPRQPPGDAFSRLIACADVLLHPFPFGGSRTSSDGLAAGVPVLTRPVASLRGRMAASFYATMNLTAPNWTLCASSADEYVAFAAKLALDDDHRRRVTLAVRERSNRIWEDMSVVEEWAKFLARVSPQSWSTRDLYDAGRLEDAVLALRAQLALAPSDLSPSSEAKVRSDLGAVLQQLGKYDQAERELRRSLHIITDSPIALNNLAVTLHESGRYDEARALYDRLLALRGVDNGIALYNAANADRDAGNVEAAVQKLRRALGDPDWHQLLRALFEESTSPNDDSSKLAAVNSLVVMEYHLRRPNFKVPTYEPPPTETELDPFGCCPATIFDLVVQPFRAAHDARFAELLFVHAKNLKLQPMLRVHCLFESISDQASFQSCNYSTVIGRRLRFSDVSAYRFPVDSRVVIVANADIFFDHTLRRLTSSYLDKGVVAALARWEWMCTLQELKTPTDALLFESQSGSAGDCATFVPRIDSQDAWILSTKFVSTIFQDLHVELGRPRCDNFVAAYVQKHTALEVTSPSLAVKAYHLQHRFRMLHTSSLQDGSPSDQPEADAFLRSYTDSANEIKGATAHVKLSGQWLF